MTETLAGDDTNRFTALVGCRFPVQLAVMGGIVDARLAGAVGANGGLGMLSGALASADQLVEEIDATRALAGNGVPVGVGFLLPFLDVGAWDAAAEHADLVEGFYGDPDELLVDSAHERGALVSWQVGSVGETRMAIDAGCDVLVVQGVEAGGHVRGSTPLDELVAEVRPMTKLPLVAAGGIGTADRATELRRAGADAIRLGTVFLACTEADVHPDYRAALIAASGDETTLTETFSLLWPGAPHRVLTGCIAASDDDPSQRSPLPPNGSFVGDVSSAALYAGRSVDSVARVTSVAEVFADFGFGL